MTQEQGLTAQVSRLLNELECLWKRANEQLYSINPYVDVKWEWTSDEVGSYEIAWIDPQNPCAGLDRHICYWVVTLDCWVDVTKMPVTTQFTCIHEYPQLKRVLQQHSIKFVKELKEHVDLFSSLLLQVG